MFIQPNPNGQTGSLSIPVDAKRAHRLSKPRTITGSSSSLTLKSMGSDTESESPNSQNSTFGEKYNAMVTSPGEDFRGRRDSRQRIRAHLFGSSQESLQADSEEDSDNKKGFVDTARVVCDRISRTGTMVSRRASLRMSMAPLNTSQSRLSLVPEASLHDVEDSERVIDQIKEKAFYDSLAAMNHVSSPVDEDMHVDAVASPIRRRSLFTPGLATRVPDDILRKPPPPQRIQSEADRDYYYNPNRPESSPLGKIAALEFVNPHRFSPIPRASTPSDMDYAHLGGLRPGTLRITNGNSSPVPRIRSPSSTEAALPYNFKCEEDYFSRAVPMHNNEEERSKSFSEENCYHDTEVDVPVDTSTHADKRLAEVREFLRSAMPTTNTSTENSLREQAWQLLALDNENPSCTIIDRGRSLSLQPISTDDRTSGLAQEYRSELPDSPFISTDNSQAMSLSFVSTSERNEFNDKLFDDDVSAVSTKSEGCPSRLLDAPRSLKYTSKLLHAQASDSYGNSTTIIDAQLMSTTTTAEKADDIVLADGYVSSNSDLTKADSGYDSSASSESVRRKSLPSEDRVNTLQPKLKSSLKVLRSPSGPRNMPRRPASVAPSARPLLLTVPVLTDSASKSLAPSSSGPVSTLASSNSTQSQGSSSPRKLRKSRPLSLPPPISHITVQSCGEIDASNIPPVSDEIAARHAERLRLFPLLDHTFPSSNHTGMNDGASSPEVTCVPIRFPSPTKGLEDVRSSSAIRSSRRFSFTRGRRMSLTRRNNDSSFSDLEHRPGNHSLDDYSLADFGDINVTLGGDPYDAAKSVAVAHWKPSKNSFKSSLHPTTIATPKVKIGMDEEQATEFARLRSQNKCQSLSSLEVESLSTRTKSSTEIMWRPISMTVDVSSAPPMPALPSKDVLLLNGSFNDRGGVPGKMPRPKSVNAPPVPPLPNLVQVQQKDLEVRSSSAQLYNTREITRPTLNSYPLIFNQAIEEPEQPEKIEVDVWELQRRAWSERRRTAIEGLHTANSSKETSMNEPPTRRAPSPPGLHVPAPRIDRSHLPLTPPHSLPTSKRGSMTSLEDHEMAESSIQRLAGRFDGGLKFLYEPGYGVGGSAGTRNMRTGASRKSVDVSRGYGIDLSDVPIFIAPAS